MRQWRLRLGTVTCAAMLSAVSMPLAAGSKTVNMCNAANNSGLTGTQFWIISLKKNNPELIATK